ncbi:MAG: hypothetical protein ACXAC8_02695 [Candidatus Hodarchaeales archaeon]|jgi:hypothetical protein
MADLSDIIAGVCVVLAVVLAIFSNYIMEELIGELMLFLIEIGLLVVIIGTAIYGQRITTSGR